MRRGTQAAREFGKYLEDRRLDLGLSMRKVGAQLGVAAATVSQAERGERAVKENRLSAWAKALQVDEDLFRETWFLLDHEYPVGPVVRRRSTSPKPNTLEGLILKLTGPQRARVQGYIEAVLEEEAKS